MRTPPFRLLSVAFSLGLLGVACDASLQDEGPTEEAAPSVESETTTTGSILTDAESFHAVYRFQGSFDPETGFSFEPAVLQASEYRTADQALWCGMTIVADGTAGSGPVDTVEVVGDPASIFRDAACFPGGVYPAPQIVYLASRALCQDVTVRSFFDTETLTNTHAVIDFVSVPGYEAYNVPGVTGATSPGGDNLPNTSRGLWSYGNLGPNGSGTNSGMNRWIFRYPQEQAFQFNGRIIAEFQEVCGNATDDDCDGRVNEGCQAFAVGDLCTSNLDCVSVNCDPGTSRCATTTCGDGLLNGTETALDCGGLCPTKCANGLACTVGGDCLSGVCRTGTCRQFRAPAAGEVVVSEVMANPVGDDTLGEWLELTNLANVALDLTGCVLTDAGVDNHAIGTTLSIPANGRVVLGVNGTTATNGGVTLNYVWSGGYFLGNSGDEVRLTCDGVLIDAYPVPTSQVGYSSQVSSATLTAVGNDSALNSCRSTASYGTAGNFGTPGAGNGTCELTNINCRVSRPASAIDSNAPSSAVVEAIVNVPGLTDLTTRANPAAQLQVQAAYVPTGTDAATLADGNWAAASAVGGASTSPAPFAGSDLYRATVSVTGATGSTGNLVYRARGSVSSPWTLCDGDAQGSFDGFTVATAPGVTIVPAAPAPNAAGQFQITEYLINGFNPAVSTERNEFVEFRNTTLQTLDLNGCVFTETGGTAITVSTPTLVGPGGYVVLARSDSQFSKVGYTFIPFVADWAFNNADATQTISLTCGATPIATIVYNQGTQGVSQQLAPVLWGTGNRAASDYCPIPTLDATTSLDADPTYLDYGTPGRDNSACAALNPIAACYLNGGVSSTAANTFNTVVNAPATFTARVEIPGLTDNSNANNIDVRVVGEVGYGPVDTNPSADESAYTWFAVSPTPSFNSTSGEDQYEAPVTVASAGTFALVARFSQDGGATWTYCDSIDEPTGGNVFDLALADVVVTTAPPTLADCVYSDGVAGANVWADSAVARPSVSVRIPGVTDATTGLDPSVLVTVSHAWAIGTTAPALGALTFVTTTTAGLPASDAASDAYLAPAFSVPNTTLSPNSVYSVFKVEIAGGAVHYCGGLAAGPSPFASAITPWAVVQPFSITSVTQNGTSLSTVEGSRLALSANLLVPNLTDRVSGSETSPLVTVEHSFVPTGNAASFSTTNVVFDTTYAASNTDTRYKADLLAPRNAGVYDSQFRACYNGGSCVTSAVRTITLTASPVWINEINYAASAPSEGVEIAGLAGTNLAGWTLVYRAASGNLSGTDLSLSGTITSVTSGVGTLFFSRASMGTAGQVALVSPDGAVVDHLSWGTITGVPNSGLAIGSVNTATGVLASSPNTIGRTGTGCSKAEFATYATTAFTQAAINDGQTTTCAPPALPPVDSCSATFGASAYIGSPVTANVSVTLAGVTDVSATVDPLLEIESQIIAEASLPATAPAAGWSTTETFVAQVGSAHTYTVSANFLESSAAQGYVVRARYSGGPWTYCYADGLAPGTYDAARVPTATPTAYGTPSLAQQAPSLATATEGTSSITYTVRLAATGLTDRTTPSENSALVEMQHSVFPAAGSPTYTAVTPGFDATYAASNPVTQYTSARAITGLTAGTYTSRFRVRIDGGAWVESGDQTITITAAPPAATTPTSVLFCFEDSAGTGTLSPTIQVPSTANSAWTLSTLTVTSPTFLLGPTGEFGCTAATSRTYSTQNFLGTTFDSTSGPSRYMNLSVVLTPGTYQVSFRNQRSSTGPNAINVWLVPPTGAGSNLFTTNISNTGTSMQALQTSNTFTVLATGTYNLRVYGLGSTNAGGTFRLESFRISNSSEVIIPSGTFLMGSPSTELGRDSDANDENTVVGTQATVTISRNYLMQTTEVTQGQWKALSGGVNPSCFQSTTGTSCTTSNANDNGPVEGVDWYSAVAYSNALSTANGLTPCYTLVGCTDAVDGWKDGQHSGCTAATFAGLTCTGYRLPTEAEWERAARAGTTTATWLGNLSGTVTGCGNAQGSLNTIAWWCVNSGSRAQTVATKLANPWGLFDMLGNLWEWVGDFHQDNYPGTVTDPLGPATGASRTVRGGNWRYAAEDARAASRDSASSSFRSDFIGFRLARSL
jgi:formylglycine-generating enzyme required for sulfatase activity